MKANETPRSATASFASTQMQKENILPYDCMCFIKVSVSYQLTRHKSNLIFWQLNYFIKTSGSELRGQEEAASTRISGLRDHYSKLFARMVGLNF